MEGETAEWMVTLHNNSMELCNFDRFMAALRKRFEDSLADLKARIKIKTKRQGR